jgi:subtilisin family serine protease
MHPWDVAHGVLDYPQAAGLESARELQFVEPDFEQSFPYELQEPETLESALERAESCVRRGINWQWPNPGNRFAWHLDDDYSQLRTARSAVGDPGDGKRIQIGILDTGYDPGHSTLPLHMRYDLARNLTGDGPETNATDPGSNFPMTNPGHGTATLALLAGNVMDAAGSPPLDDYLGGAPFAEVVPIRIANSVIHFRTSAMAQGIEYAAKIGCQVISISMGGVPTQLWADAVNMAYESGMCIFAAAGNRIGPAPPASLVYPARFNRVVAVCGFTADNKPYFIDGLHRQMHGCYGPPSAMKTAMAAYTPNTPWADMGCGSLVNPDGAGTSSATPQCAAAATLWLQKHRPNPSEKWQVVEAVRHALFSSADKNPVVGTNYFGNGLLRASDALGIPFKENLAKTLADTVSFPWLRLVGALESVDDTDTIRQKMFETEALQLYLQSPSLQRIAGGADPHVDELDRETLIEFVKQIRTMPSASKSLRRNLDEIRCRL